MEYFPLHVHSHYSLLDGLSKPEQIASRVKEIGAAGSALTDHGSIAGSVGFLKAMKKAGKKAVLGCEFYLSARDAARREKENRSLSHLCVLAKNRDGWKSLLRAVSASNTPEFFYHKPRLDLDRLGGFAGGNLVTFSGHMGSDLANVLFAEPKLAYRARSEGEARGMLDDGWKAKATELAGRYREQFGRDNFFLEIQLIDAANLPAAAVVASCLRELGAGLGIPCVATADSHYARKGDAVDQRILLCSAFETTLNQVDMKLAAQEDVSLGAFFRSNRYHIPSFEEMAKLHTGPELANTLRVAEMCDSYDVLGRPMLPAFECPDGLSPDEYLKQLCREGWRRLIIPAVRDGKVRTYSGPAIEVGRYAERIRHELEVLLGAGLASYFLIVQDYCNWARAQGWMVGKGRGSGAGCLASYLLGITEVDPLEYGLIFERFYNAGRNTKDRVSLPDIDCDFPISKRAQVKEYLRRKYGDARVSEMVTFSRMQGRGALKDVLRAHEACSFEEMNRVTAPVPDEAEIADQLQEMREETGEASIIRWALLNEPEALKEWVTLKEDGTLEGPMAPYFAQAIRLEGTKRSQGKHAAGVIISSQDLAEVAPMVHDKATGQPIAGLEMNDLESLGHVKFDILGVAVLDKLMGAVEIIRTGKLAA